MIDRKGWLANVKHCHSPNFNQRPSRCEIDLLVIHSISLPPGEYGNNFIDDFFCNRLETSRHPYFQEISEFQVSSHLFISRHGVVTQYVSFLDRAWHAGASSFQGRENCNDFSIGIELEGLEGEAFEDIQYQRLIELCESLAHEYPNISKDRICRHSDISPGRKLDPGDGFHWELFLESLKIKSNHKFC